MNFAQAQEVRGAMEPSSTRRASARFVYADTYDTDELPRRQCGQRRPA